MGVLAHRDDRARRLDAREPGPRGRPALGGLRPPLQGLGPWRSVHPDAVELPPAPDLVGGSPVRDDDPVKHDASPSCSCLTGTLGTRPEGRLSDLSSIPDTLIRGSELPGRFLPVPPAVCTGYDR